MNYPLLLSYLAAIFLLIATPGPIVALVLNSAARYGFKRAVVTVLGTNLASLVLLSIAALIIAGVIQLEPHYLSWISLLGCVFIGWMAIDGLRHELTEPVAKPPELNPTQSGTGFVHGFLMGISNPKDIVFFVAFFPQFIGITASFKLSLSVLTLCWIAVDFLILFSYITLVRNDFFQRQKRKISLLSLGFLLLIALIGGVYSVLELVGG
ncbi:hypothetical protein AKN94_08210 [Thiopseudomonas alkaliphila]|uniref:LysE family translocator n=1 Tax=Thiopseudomonas alkaliphila TaxID=1697053 RepID=UPI00069D8375|nr:LysE family translocator [Thiopseudomonas alkaliphila]AKX47342.1 hypothetical protein AKN94_08210 [Thiopseudomonas alkaliphila]